MTGAPAQGSSWAHNRPKPRVICTDTPATTHSVEAGQSLNQSIVDASQELRDSHPDLSAELAQVHLELHAGKSRADVCQDAGDEDLLGRSTIIDIVHQEGEPLIVAQRECTTPHPCVSSPAGR